jgi:hypothetical protein
VREAVEVGLVTAVVKSGERFPAAMLVTDPVPLEAAPQKMLVPSVVST